jgi:hypothetical protein
MGVEIMKRTRTTALKPETFKNDPHRSTGRPPGHLIGQRHCLFEGFDQKLHQLLALLDLEPTHQIVITREEGRMRISASGGRLAQSDRLQGPGKDGVDVLRIRQTIETNRGRPETVKSRV